MLWFESLLGSFDYVMAKVLWWEGFIVIAISGPDGQSMTKRWRSFLFWNSGLLWLINTTHKNIAVEVKVHTWNF